MRGDVGLLSNGAPEATEIDDRLGPRSAEFKATRGLANSQYELAWRRTAFAGGHFQRMRRRVDTSLDNVPGNGILANSIDRKAKSQYLVLVSIDQYVN